MNRVVAIVLLVAPVARRSSTSRSRGVSRLSGPSRARADSGRGTRVRVASRSARRSRSRAPISCAALQHSTRSSRPSSRPPWASSSVGEVQAWLEGEVGAERLRQGGRCPELSDGRLPGVPGGVGVGERELDPVVGRAPLVGEPASATLELMRRPVPQLVGPGPGRRPTQAQGLEADPAAPADDQRRVAVVELGQVRPRRLEGAGPIVEHRRELELGQDLGVPPRSSLPSCANATVSCTSGVAASVSPRASSSSARGGCQRPLAAVSPSSSSSSSRRSASSRRPRHRSAYQRRAPAQGRLFRKPQRHALLEALTRDGLATIDLSGLHVLHGRARRARARLCPLPVPWPRPVPSPRVRRRCGRGRRARGIARYRASTSASTHPAILAASMAPCAASTLAAKRACRFRYSDWAFRARASSSVGESPAYSMASRIAS